MKRIRKKVGIVYVLLIFCFMLAACDNKGTEGEQTIAPIETKKPEDSSEGKKEEQAVKEKDITIYSINDESLESEQTKVQIKGEITPKAIVNAVVAAFADHSLTIGIDSVKQDGSNVIVSFLYSKAPLSQVGSDVEETILNSIADSLIDNLTDCKGVIFRAEGEAYESGHFAFGKNELYVRE